ncbi:ABC-type Fe3+-hydroxamate transport system, periplasmic component [Corynebacterium kutscheri]|uniref:ABC-type Fe3+-hydroxamate transport system, periplasmic component n=1 Tax=Corynebacterium kutscheri TaxID=35755 RepID=A0A0F6R3E5_9CORY|nr:iron-siderophore ABC transporter substrate-binding protein [Corynebacterium kutscheri]AKE42253.1 ABC-type Fe3+-hydroxamate transport system, periplasmic component [Corynebacterium kutscheri]VEH05671.1 ABC-type Fe3+-hydroxamate transport system, periplasmic component [Corynebacterium kutscheri]VEH10596.1 ABC-type Fe3+-hydroxamate transport system, periplasmic component [Corynebacterium kutscheri]VEH81566.1 ABC-type Fe3+-hydroxamate transport system, periplasmic component [Corynebacterium kuts
MRINRAIVATAAALLALTLTACSTENTSSSNNSSQSASTSDSVTIKHAFGETVIQGTPERIATVGWANHEVPLALGVVPVGISRATFGDDDGNGILPWVEDKLAELGGETPVLFDETDGIPFEQVADTKPDVILAAYSGMTQEDYDKLSKIAPVIAQPGEAWQTSLEEMNLMDSQGMNQAAAGEKLNQDLKQEIADTMAAYPALKGKKVLFTSFGYSKEDNNLGFYTTNDPRAGFLQSAGFEVPTVVKEDTQTASGFWSERSLENPEAFDDVDVFISYGSDDEAENQETLKALQENPLTGRIPAVQAGRVVFLGNGPIAAAANPTPLSIPATLDTYFGMINQAATR